MGRRTLSFGSLSGFAAQDMFCPENTNRRQKEEYLRFLKRAIEHELTKRQRQIVLLYFYEHKTMTEISQLLLINKSTVSRTMRRALERLRHLAGLYFSLAK